MSKALKDMTMLELVEEGKRLSDDPANLNPDYLAGNSIYIHNDKTRKRLDKIAELIQDKVAEGRAARCKNQHGTLHTAGYSGRQTNRRR